MAGMPPALIERANEILLQLESKHVDEDSTTPKSEDLTANIKKLATPKLQLSIFDAHSETFDEIRRMLDSIDINRLTPVEALMKLNEIKMKVK
jgi:DNA mismatch repair protein MutS